jgi:mono/diheme cytochrome c family protein
MKILIILLGFATCLILSSCTNPKGEKPQDNNNTNASQGLAKGFQLLEQNCFTCHSPNASGESKVAPTIAVVKSHYAADNISEEEFTKQLIAFMNDPSETTSKMSASVKRFGLMPKMNLSNEQLENIAKYLYNTELEDPDWFEKHYADEKKKHGTFPKGLTPIEQGRQLALQTKGVLGRNLLNAINTKGTENALEFCSLKAIELTDSMSLTLNAKIKRVSDKNRNPDNAASEEELKYILIAKDLLSKNQKPVPQIVEKNRRWIAYYPIFVDKLCLQCHGQKNSEILPNTLSKINKLYPNDKAFGYKLNELRGIWVVDMKK